MIKWKKEWLITGNQLMQYIILLEGQKYIILNIKNGIGHDLTPNHD